MSVPRLVPPSDHTQNGCVICILDDDGVVVGGYTATRSQGEEFGAEAAALRRPCVDRELH